MKHKTSLFAALLLLVAITLIYMDASKKQAALMQDMVALDRSYIPVLVYTAADDVSGSRKAMTNFLQSWEAFKQSNIDMGKFDPAWDEDMDKVEDYIQHADILINEGGKLLQAHELLEQIRDVMLEVRVRNDMDYLLDYLTRFHASMEVIVSTVHGKTEATLSDHDIGVIEEELNTTEMLWQGVMSAKLDAKLFGFDKKQLKLIDAIKLEERDKIEQLRQALVVGDKAVIIKSALALKPPFARLFKMFGDFSLMS